MPEESKKNQTVRLLFEECKKKGDFSFTNEDVKRISLKTDFRNHNDATHIGNREKLPEILQKEDYFIIHTGRGRHKFVEGIDKAFHTFEPIAGKPVQEFKRGEHGIIDEINTSESNILSVAYNQRIISHFLYDSSVIPRVYNSHRTGGRFRYWIGDEAVDTGTKQQIEIDFTIEHNREVSIFEAKNGFPKDFAVYQLYMPFLYYTEAEKEKNLGIKKINCCYLLRKKANGSSCIRIYLYEFTDPLDMASIKLVKSREYLV